MVTFLEAVLLGIVQGITEWLPISSSGHLVLFQEWLGLDVPIIFDIMLHVATLSVILLVFWKEARGILGAALRLDFKSKDGKMLLFIISGSIPTAIIGLVFLDFFKGLFQNANAVGIALIINAVVLFLTRFADGIKKLKLPDALLIGIAQGIAITPGISRSGITISTGLFRGIEKKTLAAFSFLLSVPVIIGAAVLESRDLVVEDIAIMPLLAGMVVSVVVGYLSLRLLLKVVMKQKLHLFSYYCLALGLVIVML